jgi:hypothetical protein
MGRARGKMATKKPKRREPERVQLARVERSYDLRTLIARFVFGILFVLALWIPLQPVTKAVESLAGEDTEFVAVVNVSVAISITILVSQLVCWWKVIKQREQLQQNRERITRLENELRDVATGGNR